MKFGENMRVVDLSDAVSNIFLKPLLWILRPDRYYYPNLSNESSGLQWAESYGSLSFVGVGVQLIYLLPAHSDS